MADDAYDEGAAVSFPLARPLLQSPISIRSVSFGVVSIVRDSCSS